jgi:pimeloyl-ACP methyl ester carboxylesterase
MTPECARDIVDREGRTNPDMVTLARHLSIAAVIEVELIRAMRLRAMPNVDAGVEADLFFSPLVLARDVSSIVMYPEVRDVLHEDLRLLKDELATAREVTELAHEGMDAAILLEEAVAYYALRDDAKGYAAMQRQLGTLVRELEKPDLDDDLLLWVDQILETLPDRALNSAAGKAFSRLFNTNLVRIRDGFAEALTVVAGWDPERIGFELRSKGLSLFTPAPSGWQSFELPGPLPVRVEVGYPVAGGWYTKDIMVSTPNQATQRKEIPFGLIRFRGDGGDEIRVRPKGPFHELRPKLLVLHASPVYSRPENIEHELEDLEWERESRPLRSNVSTNVFISHSAKSDVSKKRLDSLTKALIDEGLTPWVDEDRIEVGDQWNVKITQALKECRVGIVLLDRDALSSDFVKYEFSALNWRRKGEAGFILYILIADDVALSDIASGFYSGIDESHILKWSDGHRTIVQQLKALLLPAEVSVESCTAILMDFDTLEDFDKYIDSLRPTGGSESGLDSHLDGVVQRSIPILIRVDEQLGRVRYHQVLVLKGDDRDYPATRRRWIVEALKRFQLNGRREPTSQYGDGESSLRGLLVEIENQAIKEWRKDSYAKERAVAPNDPPHAMVMIRWDAWFPEGSDAPRHFDTYRSRQDRLAMLMDNGGTIWVVTSRKDAEGNRRYQLAYRLEDVDIVSRPMPVKTKASIARDYVFRAPTARNVLQFPLHDATQTLLQLNFTTGRPMEAPGDIGRRLQSIPQLSVADVDRLNAFAAQFTNAPDEGAIVLRCRFSGEAPGGHRGTVRSIVLTEDGKMALTAGNSHPDQCVKYWDLDRGVLVQTFEGQALPGGRTPMAISPDGRLTVVGYEGLLRVLDLGSGKMVHEIRAARQDITALAFFDDTFVLAGTAEGNLLEVDLKSGQYSDRQAAVKKGAVLRIAIDQGQALLLGALEIANVDIVRSKRGSQITWRLEAPVGEPELPMQGPPLAVDRKHGVAMYGDPLQFLNLRENIVQKKLETEWSVVEAINGRVLTTDGESSFRVLDTPYTEPLEEVRIAPERAACAALSADGRRLVIADYEHNLHVYDLPPMTAIEDFHSRIDFRDYEWIDYYKQFNYFSSENIREDCYPLKMEHASSDKAIVLVHGLTDSPYYMRAIGTFFHENLGYNVYIPLLHGHGLKNPGGMEAFDLNLWKANVGYAIETAAASANEVSIGGLSTGGTLSFFMAETNPAINGTLYLFSAAFDLGGGPSGVIGELKDRLLNTFLPDLLDTNKPLIGENPYRYSHIDLDGARELARLIKETDTLMDGYSEDHPFQKKVFAVHSEVDTTADIAGIEKLQRISVPEYFHFFRIQEAKGVRHASVVLEAPIAAGTKILESENPRFDQMMAAIAEFDETS